MARILTGYYKVRGLLSGEKYGATYQSDKMDEQSANAILSLHWRICTRITQTRMGSNTEQYNAVAATWLAFGVGH